ncbi:hypothetical protein B9T36_10975 [Acinetobacter sp. ANC 4204]|uniref:hypothetical protein n=1 Tax=Acinetobacter sp. ANC 4204 TaxID=1977884 RepID=UPI000A339F66|nr:hypothetical protein [Acinetobacter sp. ANC 4204]OTG58852.1 hypothetical protein B9T36_10975 [Acinetobacter sp. ANC 4204]
MNAQSQFAPATQTNFVGFLNPESFEFSQRVANMLSNSTMVPEQYRAVTKVKAGKDSYGNMMYRDEPNPNGLPNCIIALNMSNRLGADVMMIMQNLHVIEGRPSWSSQFILGSINSSGRFSPLRFEVENLGELEVEYQETVWNNGRKNQVTKSLKVENQTCVAWALEAGTRMPEFTLEELKEHGGVYKCCKAYGIPLVESSKISMEMAVKEGWYTKNGSKWKTMPEQMLRYRAASFFGRVYAPELLMGLRSVEEEQDRIIDVTPDQSLSEQADTNKLKREILSAKSPAALDETESKVLMLTDDAKREELLKMISAQAKKFQPASNVVNDQNSTSNDVAEKAIAEKKPEPKKEGAPPVEKTPLKKPTSAEVKKDYLVKMNQVETVAELNQLREQFVINDALTEAHLSYLKSAYTQHKANFDKPAEEEVKEAPAVNEIKSSQIIGGLKIQIGNAQNITELDVVAKSIRDNKPNITPDHMNDVLDVFAARKKFLENQLSMFDTDDTPWADKAISEIEAAKNQDEINNIFIDPMYEEQSDPDQQRITNAAQKRESELFGN